MPRRALTSMLLTLLLALAPAGALADGAGDEQYQDPLAAPTAPKQPKKKTATTTPAPAATGVPATATATAPAAATQPHRGARASARELPRTGLPAAAVGLAGVTLVAAGTMLRRRAAPQ